MDDLKPCPFCGSDPMPEFYSSEDGSGYAIHCQAEACPAWPSVHGENEEEAIAAWNARAPDPRLAEVEAERDGLRAIVEKHQKRAEWFYVTEYEQNECEMSIDDVLDRMDLGIGSHVICVDVAAPLPSIWCAVRILSDDEADAQETDDRTVFTEHATEVEARAALGARP